MVFRRYNTGRHHGIPLLLMWIIDHLDSECQCNQIWYADDAGAGGSLAELRKWWTELCGVGPCHGYFPKPSKSWLIVKPGLEEEARRLFDGLGLNISVSGMKSYLGSPIGTNEFIKSVFSEKVDMDSRFTPIDRMCEN